MSLSDDIGLPVEPQPTVTSSIASVEAGAPSPRVPRERSGPGEGLVLFLWSVLVIGAVVVVLMRADQDELHDPVKQAARGEVTGLGPLSLLRADQFGGAMAAISDRYPDGRPTSIRIEPTRVDASVRTPPYALRRLSIDVAMNVQQDGQSESTDKGLAMSRIDPAAPERFVRAVNELTKTQPTDVDYVVLLVDSAAARDSRWTLFLKRGTPPDQRNYVSDLSGRHVEGNF